MKIKLLLSGLLVFALTIVSARIYAQCCVAPTNLQVRNIKKDEAKLVWQRVFQAGCTTPVKYKVQYKKVGVAGWTTVIVITPADDRKGDTSIHGLTPGTTYEWRVQGICSATNKTVVVKGPNFTTLTFAGFAASTTSSDFAISISPNPVHDRFTLSISSKIFGMANVTITDVAGMPVYKKNLSVNSHDFSTVIDASKFTNGLYHVTAQIQSKTVSLNILKN